LLARICAGDRDAVSIIYTALFDQLWRIALLQTRSSDTASEIVHDVFLWLWAHRETVATDIDIRVYLATAVRNRARTLARHAKVVDAVVTQVDGNSNDMASQSPAMGQPMPPSDVLAEEHDFRAAYQRAITILTEQERLAIYLRWEEEWAFEQIGQTMSLSKVGARKVVLRAQRKIQELLAQYRNR